MLYDCAISYSQHTQKMFDVHVVAFLWVALPSCFYQKGLSLTFDLCLSKSLQVKQGSELVKVMCFFTVELNDEYMNPSFIIT